LYQENQSLKIKIEARDRFHIQLKPVEQIKDRPWILPYKTFTFILTFIQKIIRLKKNSIKRHPMRRKPTPNQQKVLDYLKQKIKETGTSPSLRTAAAELAISHAAVAQTLKALEDKAYIKREGRYSRTLHILDHTGALHMAQRQKQIPVIGHITAGLPMYAQQEWGGSLLVDASIFPGQNLFALKIQGHSMKNAGILDQDLAICEPRQYARDKEIVVALIHHEEATVKRFFLHPDCIELRPENPAFNAQKYKFEDVLIQGKVMGIVRGPKGMEI
jgi:repressor LexA